MSQRPEPSPTTTTRAPSLRLRLLALVGVVAAGLLSLGGTAIWQAHDAARQRAAEQLLGTARALALLVDQEFARAEALLQAAAAHPGMAEGHVATFLDVAGRLGRALDGLVLAMAERPGRQVANTLEGGLDPPKPVPGGLETVFATNRTAISDLYRGSVTGRPTVAVAVPVPAPDRGPPRYALGISLNRGQLSAALRAQRLPEGAVAAVLDRRDIVAARTRREAETIGQPATPELRAALAVAEEGIVPRLADLEGQIAMLAFARAPVSRYAVAIAVPQAVFARERNQALARLAAFAAPVAIAGLLAALLLGLRLRRALAGLPVGGARPRLQEVEDLAAALAAADAARAASEAELRDRTLWLEQTQRAAAVGVWDLDLASGQFRWSETMWRLYGLDPGPDGPPDAALFRSRVVEEDLWRLDAAHQEALQAGTYEAEFRIRRGDGELRWIRAQGVMERGPDGAPLRLLGANLDLTERRALEEERESLLAQKDLLVAEMHHRVKNSLQLVQGLLLLQARGAAPEVAERLREAAGRIVSIAAVHRRLYEGGAERMQDAADHLAGLGDDLGRSLGSSGRQVALAAMAGVRLPPERMAALGLLATELVTNAFKHGEGTVTLRLRRAEDPSMAELQVEDAGPGFADGFDPAQTRGLGMRVALAMARQLRGTLEVGPGARVTARFPLE